MNIKILFLLLIFYLNSIAQQYAPMAVENANWIIVHSDSELFPPFNDDVYYGYSIKGDTLVNSIEYKKIYYRRFFTVNSFDEEEVIQPPFTIGYEYIFGAIRDDIVNKKVYGINFCQDIEFSCLYCNEESVLFDFSLDVGESNMDLCIYDNNFYVNNIEFNQFFGYNRKVFNFESDYNSIEGIGSSFGLFEYALGCFCDETTSLYDYCIGEDSDCFSEFLLSNDNYFTQNNIKLFYNSSDKQLQLTNNVKDVVIEIYSVLGKKIIVEQINTTLDASQLQKGVYFYNLSKDNARKKGKVLIY